MLPNDDNDDNEDCIDNNAKSKMSIDFWQKTAFHLDREPKEREEQEKKKMFLDFPFLIAHFDANFIFLFFF